MNERKYEIATVYAALHSVSVDAAISHIFDTKHSMRLTLAGYEYYKTVVVPARIELVGPLTNRHSLFLHRYMMEPFLLINRANKPVVFIFEEKIAAYLLLSGNDFDRFVKSKMATLPE